MAVLLLTSRIQWYPAASWQELWAKRNNAAVSMYWIGKQCVMMFRIDIQNCHPVSGIVSRFRTRFEDSSLIVLSIPSHPSSQLIPPPSQYNLSSRSRTSVNTVDGLPSQPFVRPTDDQYYSSSSCVHFHTVEVGCLTILSYTRHPTDSPSGSMSTTSRRG